VSLLKTKSRFFVCASVAHEAEAVALKAIKDGFDSLHSYHEPVAKR
jgi:hypothetical protein